MEDVRHLGWKLSGFTVCLSGEVRFFLGTQQTPRKVGVESDVKPPRSEQTDQVSPLPPTGLWDKETSAASPPANLTLLHFSLV